MSSSHQKMLSLALLESFYLSKVGHTPVLQTIGAVREPCLIPDYHKLRRLLNLDTFCKAGVVPDGICCHQLDGVCSCRHCECRCGVRCETQRGRCDRHVQRAVPVDLYRLVRSPIGLIRCSFRATMGIIANVCFRDIGGTNPANTPVVLALSGAVEARLRIALESIKEHKGSGRQD